MTIPNLNERYDAAFGNAEGSTSTREHGAMSEMIDASPPKVDPQGLVIGLATRGRPELLLATLTATLPNIVDGRTKVLVFIDEDDVATKDALAGATLPPFKGRLIGVVRPRPLTIGAKWNWMTEEPGTAYLVMVDHSCHLTPGFDKMFLDAAAKFNGGPGVVLGPQANLSFHCANCMTRAWVDAVGYIYPPYFPYWFTDHWMEDVAKMTGLTELIPVVVDSSKKPFTSELREPDWWATWFDVARSLRVADAKKVIGADEDEAFRRRCDLINHRSAGINHGVRAQAKALSSVAKLSLVDERYLRIKDQAKAMLPELLATLTSPERDWATSILYPPTHIQNIPKAYAAEMRE